MNLQSNRNVDQCVADIDRAIAEIEHASKRDLAPPAYGDQHRSAITSLIEGISVNLVERINHLRKVLDRVEQAALQDAARQQHGLQNHVTKCQCLDNQVRHLEAAIAEMERDVREP